MTRYENAVRVRNGCAPRTVYYLRAPAGKVPPSMEGPLSSLILWQTVEGITVEDRRAIEQIHCECPALLPISVDCIVREKATADDLQGSNFEQNCQVRLLPTQRLASDVADHSSRDDNPATPP